MNSCAKITKIFSNMLPHLCFSVSRTDLISVFALHHCQFYLLILHVQTCLTCFHICLRRLKNCKQIWQSSRIPFTLSKEIIPLNLVLVELQVSLTTETCQK